MRPLVGIAVLTLGGALILLSILLWPLWPPAFFGLILILSALIERRYRGKTVPETGWEPTSERFIDDESGVTMQVWYNPATGQRDYRPEER
ncbi:MAG: hypothetical protein KGJ57_10955 [Sphingomonadales bacterium]|nr:hypothetical protein [Sphingomonadales bacterium]MDE2169932.1 hypothetical protein [Sphingomonadales bacterium]